jgi:hypothetical protein
LIGITTADHAGWDVGQPETGRDIVATLPIDPIHFSPGEATLLTEPIDKVKVDRVATMVPILVLTEPSVFS